MRIVVLILLLGLGGCSTWNNFLGLGPENALGGNGRVNLSGPNQLLPPEVESFSSPQQLADTIWAAAISVDDAHPCGAKGMSAGEIQTDEKAQQAAPTDNPLPAAIACVDNLAASSTAEGESVRNGVVGQLMIASDQRCNLYFTYLTNLSSSIDATSGVLGTIFGGVGTIINSLPATRIFSGLAGISSGVGGNLDAALFQRAAISVIVPAIQKTRDAARLTIQGDYSESYQKWRLASAMDDVIHYHGLCDLNNGIIAAQKAVANQGVAPAKSAPSLADIKIDAPFLLSNGDIYKVTGVSKTSVTPTTTVTYSYIPKAGSIVPSLMAPAAVFLKIIASPAS